ncbi:unnamed protein product [Vicia faba]|uniref:Uncharacterized protein n=1 Tax=Vicia faba TaxID=3906 RepID=A0AAV0ZGZ7_VICFA|nr:unnamed protein product [Vicia faba]
MNPLDQFQATKNAYYKDAKEINFTKFKVYTRVCSYSMRFPKSRQCTGFDFCSILKKGNELVETHYLETLHQELKKQLPSNHAQIVQLFRLTVVVMKCKAVEFARKLSSKLFFRHVLDDNLLTIIMCYHFLNDDPIGGVTMSQHS